jgi:membrane-bound lytic murein transglycosylase B
MRQIAAANVRLALASAMIWAACIAVSLGPAVAADCQHGDFAAWLESFKQEGASQGISQKTIASALNGVTYDPAIITRDHAQSVFQQSFEQFSGRMVSPDRLHKGSKHAQTLRVNTRAD